MTHFSSIQSSNGIIVKKIIIQASTNWLQGVINAADTSRLIIYETFKKHYKDVRFKWISSTIFLYHETRNKKECLITALIKFIKSCASMICAFSDLFKCEILISSIWTESSDHSAFILTTHKNMYLSLFNYVCQKSCEGKPSCSWPLTAHDRERWRYYKG